MDTTAGTVDRGPSTTAMLAALARAVHLLWHEPPWVFTDWLAYPLVASLADERLRPGAPGAIPRTLLDRQVATIALRSRITEDALMAALERGLDQYVVLGAGLDTFAWRRRELLPGLRVFEVDQPATQGWKRSRLAQLQIPEPDGLTFVPVDFERDLLPQALSRAGVDLERPVFLSWLAVAPYLQPGAVEATLAAVAGVAGGGRISLTYMVPIPTLRGADRELAQLQSDRFTALGEPWLSLYEPPQMEELLHRLGFGEIHDIDPAQEGLDHFRGRRDGLLPTAYERVVLASW